MNFSRFSFVAVLVASVLAIGCSSTRLKERKKERERIASTSGFMCEFISAEEHQDVEVELNLQMGRKCDSDKPFSITQFKTPSENQGLMYCCSLSRGSRAAVATASTEEPEFAQPAPAPAPKKTAPKMVKPLAPPPVPAEDNLELEKDASAGPKPMPAPVTPAPKK